MELLLPGYSYMDENWLAVTTESSRMQPVAIIPRRRVKV